MRKLCPRKPRCSLKVLAYSPLAMGRLSGRYADLPRPFLGRVSFSFEVPSWKGALETDRSSPLAGCLPGFLFISGWCFLGFGMGPLEFCNK